nr:MULTISPECIES: hypothetical protein [Sphingobacterium]
MIRTRHTLKLLRIMGLREQMARSHMMESTSAILLSYPTGITSSGSAASRSVITADRYDECAKPRRNLDPRGEQY